MTPEAIEWFREDLEAVTGGDWTIRNRRYAGPPDPRPAPPAGVDRVARIGRRGLGRVRRKLGAARQAIAERADR